MSIPEEEIVGRDTFLEKIEVFKGFKEDEIKQTKTVRTEK